MLQLTGNSGTALGITTGLQFLPFLLLAPVAGLVADRMPKLRLLQLTNVAMAVPALVLGVLTVTGQVQIWQVYVLALLLGTAAVFDAPARQSFVSEIVGPDDLTNAVGLNSASFNAARIVGPALAGVLIAALGGGATATGWVILINAVTYAAPIRALRGMDRRLLDTPTPQPREPGMIREGVRYVRNRPDLAPGARHRRLHRHVRAELPDDVGADGDGGLRQGPQGVRPARHLHGGRLAHRCPARRPPRAGPPPRRRRCRAGVRSRRDRGRADADVPHLRAAHPAARDHRAHHDHQRQHLRAGPHRAGHAGPGDGALHDDLHGRYAARVAPRRLGR